MSRRNSKDRTSFDDNYHFLINEQKSGSKTLIQKSTHMDRGESAQAHVSRNRSRTPLREISVDANTSDKNRKNALKKLLLGKFGGVLRDLTANKLLQLELISGELRDAEISAISGLIANASRLKTIKLSKNRIGDEGLSHLCYSLLNSNVQTVDLSHNLISQEGLPFLLKLLKTNSKIKRVNLKRNLFDSRQKDSLAAPFKSSSCNVEF